MLAFDTMSPADFCRGFLMRRLPLLALLVLPAIAFRSTTVGQDRKPDSREWIVGTWRSYKLDYGDFAEWKGTTQIELVAKSTRDIGLFLIEANGIRFRAGDTEGCVMDEKKLFFGPVGSGLSFRYRHPSDDVLILDLTATGPAVHAELRRQKK
jgi:hypothetical protein